MSGFWREESLRHVGRLVHGPPPEAVAAMDETVVCLGEVGRVSFMSLRGNMWPNELGAPADCVASLPNENRKEMR